MSSIKLWIDDVREAPDGYIWAKSTREALRKIVLEYPDNIEIIDLDHDAGDFVKDGGDFINVLTELERLSHKTTVVNGVKFHNCWHLRCQKITFRLHTMNPVGRENMRRIIERNGWKEVV